MGVGMGVLGEGGGGVAGEGGEVGEDFDVGKAGLEEERIDGGGLVGADFEEDFAGWFEEVDGIGDEAFVEVEAGGAAVEGETRFPVADAGVERGDGGGGDVGWVGDENVDALGFVEVVKAIGNGEFHAVGEMGEGGIFAGEGDGVGGDVEAENGG